jgi:hypothetical protein
MGMKIFILLVFITANASAGCLDEAMKYSTGLKFTYSFNDIYETHRDNPDLNIICKDKQKNSLWASEVAARREGVKRSRKISEPGICPRLDREIKEREDCYHPIQYAEKLRKIDSTSMTFEELCMKLGPEIIKRIGECKTSNAQ